MDNVGIFALGMVAGIFVYLIVQGIGAYIRHRKYIRTAEREAVYKSWKEGNLVEKEKE